MSYQERRYRRMIRQVLYGLKRQYGADIAVYKLLDADTDYTTGLKTIHKLSEELEAVVIPTKIAREAIQSISQISANKAMVYGGTFDGLSKTFIIDARDLPDDWTITNDDWIVYNSQRFEIKTIVRLDYHAGWIIDAKAIVGQHAEQIFHLDAENRLTDLDHYAEVVPWSAHHPSHNIPIDQDVTVQKIMYRSAENTLTLSHSASLGQDQFLSAGSTLTLGQSVDKIKAMYRSVVTTGLVFNTLGQGLVVVKVINRIFGHEASEIELQHTVSLEGSRWNRQAESNLNLDHNVGLTGIYNRNPGNQLNLNHTADPSGSIYNRTAENTIGISHDVSTSGTILGTLVGSELDLDQTVSYSAVFNRDASSDINMDQAVSLEGSIWYRDAESTIGIDHGASVAKTLTRDVGTSLNLGQELVSVRVQYENAESDIGITHDLDNIKAIYVGASSNISANSLGHAVEVQVFRFPNVESVIGVDQAVSTEGSIWNRNPDNNSFEGTTLDLDQSVGVTGIYNRDADNDLILTQDVISAGSVFNRDPQSDIDLDQDVAKTRAQSGGSASELTLDHGTGVLVVRPRSADNVLTLSQAATVQRVQYASAQSDIGIGHQCNYQVGAEGSGISNLVCSHSVSLEGSVWNRGPDNNTLDGNTLTLGQSAQLSIVRSRGTQSALSLTHTASAAGSVWNRAPGSTLALTQQVDTQAIRNRGAANTLSMGHTAAVQKTMSKDAGSTLSILDAVNVQKIIYRSATSPLSLGQQVGLSVVRELAASNQIMLYHDAVASAVFNRTAFSTLSLDQTAQVSHVTTQTATSALTLSHDVAVSRVSNQAAQSNLSLNHTTSVIHVFNQSASNTLTLSHELAIQGAVLLNVGNTLTLSQDVGLSVVRELAAQSDLTLSQDVGLSVVRELGASSELTLDHTASYQGTFHRGAQSDLSISHDASAAGSVWNRAVQSDTGVTQDIGMQHAHGRAAQSDLNLTSTVISSGSIFNRSLDNIIGIAHLADAAPAYPRDGASNLTMGQDVNISMVRPRGGDSNLTLDQTVTNQKVMSRDIDSDIGVDHNVSHQRLAFQNPDSDIGIDHDVDITAVRPRDADSVIGVDHDVDITAVRPRDADSVIGVDHDVEYQGIFNRAGDSVLTLTQEASYQGIFNRAGSSILTLSQDVEKQAIFNREADSDIGIGHSVALSKVIFANASSTVGVDQYLCILAADMVSAWHLDETSGVRYDSWGDNDLTDWNTVGYTTGKVDNAADFILTNNEQLIAANDATLQTGNIDFMFTGWIKVDNWDQECRFWGKWDEGASEREYLLRAKADGKLIWTVSKDGNGKKEAKHSTALSANTWYFVCVYHDAVNDELGVSINNGTFATESHADGVYVGSADFTISGDAELKRPMDGAIDAVHFWKRILSTDEITYMYNSSNGRQVPPFLCE